MFAPQGARRKTETRSGTGADGRHHRAPLPPPRAAPPVRDHGLPARRVGSSVVPASAGGGVRIGNVAGRDASLEKTTHKNRTEGERTHKIMLRPQAFRYPDQGVVVIDLRSGGVRSRGEPSRAKRSPDNVWARRRVGSRADFETALRASRTSDQGGIGREGFRPDDDVLTMTRLPTTTYAIFFTGVSAKGEAVGGS
ncbi:uncharacterized protein LY79DRAFT_318554 [Colletotrichum navitas]|uniref:Uncharacterized protein n=1 Tax=Colletotrichum navitas TaxID=681940 RepID=A0AAD8PTT5_9PEZI|nr:uncharacterized protein LY79DRAFT_318554 [Colletotrichum navitas]KAK1580065.1 hypothetical protein LY79DRAFT_318554 [Colletotrichum navitas]